MLRANAADELKAGLMRFVAAEAERSGARAVDPGHRVPFKWPPHAVSHDFKVREDQWTERAEFVLHHEAVEVEVAKTEHGVFGRSPKFWAEARGRDLEEMVEALAAALEPLFARQECIACCLGRPGRFDGRIADLEALDLLKLLYCRNRDVGREAQTIIETSHERQVLMPLLIGILEDRLHPFRRAAQWAVLDLFEDLPSFCADAEDEAAAVRAMKGLLWDAQDDFCRTVYKAGVVLGGQVPTPIGGDALLESLHAPSRIGRRSAIHGLFHVVEWQPERRSEVAAALEAASRRDPEPLLQAFAAQMAEDIAEARYDHTEEPTFDEDAPPVGVS